MVSSPALLQAWQLLLLLGALRCWLSRGCPTAALLVRCLQCLQYPALLLLSLITDMLALLAALRGCLRPVPRGRGPAGCASARRAPRCPCTPPPAENAQGLHGLHQQLAARPAQWLPFLGCPGRRKGLVSGVDQQSATPPWLPVSPSCTAVLPVPAAACLAVPRPAYLLHISARPRVLAPPDRSPARRMPLAKPNFVLKFTRSAPPALPLPNFVMKFTRCVPAPAATYVT